MNRIKIAIAGILALVLVTYVSWLVCGPRIAVGVAIVIVCLAFAARVVGIKPVVGVAVSVALVVYLLARVDLHTLATQLARTHWGWVVVGAGCGLAGLYARAMRWRYLFPPREHPRGLVAALMIGYMANNVLPLRAGEFVRVYVAARRRRSSFWTAFATLVVERVLDGLAIVLILGVLVLFVPVPAVFRNAALVMLALDVAGVATLAFLAAFPAGGRRILIALTRRSPALEHKVSHVYETLVRGLDGIRTPAHAMPLLAWTAIVWLLPALAAWTTLRAVGLVLPWIAGWVVLAFVGLGISIPSAPGYVGVYHFAAAKAVELFGVDPATGVAFAIVMHASQYLIVTLVGWAYLLREGLTLGEARHVPGASMPPPAFAGVECAGTPMDSGSPR